MDGWVVDGSMKPTRTILWIWSSPVKYTHKWFLNVHVEVVTGQKLKCLSISCRCPRCCDPSWTGCWWGSPHRGPQPRNSFSTPSSKCPVLLPASSHWWDITATADILSLYKTKNTYMAIVYTLPRWHCPHQAKHTTTWWCPTNTHTCNCVVD